jgi:hypothetical protein
MKILGVFGYYKIRRSDYLKRTGWYRSMNEGKSVDANGCPIPWITYPAIDFLSKRINNQMSVFEYGSGASTLWWASRVDKIVSCEHDREWYQQVLETLPTNATLYFFALEYGGAYCQKISKYSNHFDIVVIDGRDRINCARNSLSALKSNGVIVWDNSDREEYREGLNYLAEHNFRKLEFVGMHPLVTGKSETSVLYRADNCLGI